MDFKRLHSLAVSPVREFFIRTSGVPLSQRVGVALYKTGLALTIRTLKSMPEIESIYSKTSMDEGFVVGRSDIDLALVASEMPLEKEIEFLKDYNLKSILLRALFPFMGHTELYLRREFSSHQRLRHSEIFHAGKHFKDWTLLHGAESRLRLEGNEREVSSRLIRDSYENILLNIYESRLDGEDNFRRLYKFTFGIMRSSFIHEKKREVRDEKEYAEFLKSKGVSQTFIDSLLSMPDNGYAASDDFLVQALYCSIKLIEGMGARMRGGNGILVAGSMNPDGAITQEVKSFAEKIDKRHVKSTYLSRIPLRRPSHYLYIILPDASSPEEFGQIFRSILDNLHALPSLKNDVSLGIKNRFQQDFTIFPLILTERMLDNTCFIDAGNPYESISLIHGGRKLYGSDIRLGTDSSHVKSSFKKFIHMYSLLGVKNILAPGFLRPNEKNKEVLEWLMAYRLLASKNKACLSGVKEEYERGFGDDGIKHNTPEGQYALARKILDDVWEP